MKKLTVIVALKGRIEDSINQLGKIIECVDNRGDIQLLFVFDDKKWESLPMLQLIECKKSIFQKMFVADVGTPAMLYNYAAKRVSTKYVAFWDISVDHVKERIRLFLEFDTRNDSNNILFLQRNLNKTVIPSNMNRYGLLQTGNYYHMDDFFVRKDYFENNLFFETELLYYDFFREWVLRNSRDEAFCCIGDLGYFKNNIPDRKKLLTNDLLQRYLIRCGASNHIDIDEINKGFYSDLKEYEAREIAPFLNCYDHNIGDKSYKIMILGGYWEYHHNQIVFMNYLEKVAGTGFATFNVKLETECLTTDLLNYDLVIFTRTRSQNSVKLVEYCNEHNIPSLYMLDDNWFSIAKDFPEYGNIFVEGKPEYDNFIKIVKKCSGAWYFNELIREDLSKYVSRFIKSRISVDESLFEPENTIYDKKGKLVIGYSGSLRYDDSAFRALARVARENNNVIVALVGNMSAEQLSFFDGIEIIQVPFSSYSIYAKRISEIRPDLLVAPLDGSRTSQSKCYNKYVESGVVGAACIFSEVKPYTDVVKDNINGFLLRDNSEFGWYKKINDVLKDVTLLEKVKRNAHDDVMNNHTVEAVLPSVLHNLEVVINEWR